MTIRQRVVASYLPALGLIAALVACGPSQDVAVAKNSPNSQASPDDLPETGLQGQVPLADQLSGRSAQGYRRGMKLVGANDILGRGENFELAWFEDCAYVTGGLAQAAHKGMAVIDTSDPRNPRLVGAPLASEALSNPVSSVAINPSRRLLAATEFGDPRLLEVFDVSDCRYPRLLGSLDLGAQNGGAGAAMPADGQTLYAGVCCLLNQFISPNYVPESDPAQRKSSLMAFDLSDPSRPELILKWDAQVPRHGYADIVDVDVSADGMRAYLMVFGDDDVPNVAGPVDVPSGLLIVDISDIQKRLPNPEIRLVSELYWNPNDHYGQGHSVRLVNIRGRPHVIATDMDFFGFQFVQTGAGCPWSHARIIDVADDRNPTVISEIALEVNEPEHCPTTVPDQVYYAAAEIGVDNPRNATMAFFSWFGSGLRAYDIRDPSRPIEIAYYNPPAHTIADPQTGLPTHNSDKHDVTTSRVRYDRGTGHVWFVSRDNGFQIVEFSAPAGPGKQP